MEKFYGCKVSPRSHKEPLFLRVYCDLFCTKNQKPQSLNHESKMLHLKVQKEHFLNNSYNFVLV